MDNKNGRKRVSSRRGQRELRVRRIGKEVVCKGTSVCQSRSMSRMLHVVIRGAGSSRRAELTGVVADHGPFAIAIFAVSKDAKVDAAEGSERDGANDGGRERGEEQQHKGSEE